MKKALVTAAIVAALAGPALADPVEGIWQTRPDDNGHFGFVQMAPCGAALCGTLIRAFDADGTQIESDNVGRQIVWDMQAEGGGAYGGGKVWAPDRDRTYNAKMTLDGDRLEVSGCVLGGAVCRSGGDWRRVQ